MLGEHAQAIEVLRAGRNAAPEEGRVAIDGDLVDAYVAIRQFDAAQSIINTGLQTSGRYAPYYARMAERVRAAQGGR